MTYIQRMLCLNDTLRTRSVFLLGPRQTGKSSYLRNQLSSQPDFTFNLLNQKTFLELSANPTRMRSAIIASQKKGCLVVIDEVQKLPQILNEVHLLMEEHDTKFILTGSSSRKLKQQGVNLLGGRGRDKKFHPFVFKELEEHGFLLEKAFERGLIPNHYFSDSPQEDLAAYTGRYLTEEIVAEALTRNVSSFSRFLEFAAQCNGQLINYTTLASDAGLPRATVQNYFKILSDTLIAHELPAFTKTQKRKAIQTAKFYFFDLGVVNQLRSLGEVKPETKEYGEFFEHFLYCELSAHKSYRNPVAKLEYWRSHSGFEVDFIYDGKFAIEVKASSNIQPKHLKGLQALKEENLNFKEYVVVCTEELPRRLENGILILPWKIFLNRLWSADFKDKGF
jgi:uncharacterized protein